MPKTKRWPRCSDTCRRNAVLDRAAEEAPRRGRPAGNREEHIGDTPRPDGTASVRSSARTIRQVTTKRATARTDCRNDKRGRKRRLRSPEDSNPIVRRARGTGSPGKRVLRTIRGCRDIAHNRRPQSVQAFPRGTRWARGKSSTKNRLRG